MDVGSIIRRLRADRRVLAAQVEGVEERQARWRPAPDQWSILQVVNHLADEEVEDFRTRIDLTLHRPGSPWPPIDPPRWAVERAYDERDLGESLERFEAERDRSLDWLARLSAPDWSLGYEHPVMGTVTAGDLLTSWVGHDLIHIRQLNRLHRQYLLAELSAHSAEYAGRW